MRSEDSWVEHSDSRFESIRFDSLSESIRIDSVPQKIGTSDSIVPVVGICLPNHRSTDYRSWHERASLVSSQSRRRLALGAGAVSAGSGGTHILPGSTAPRQAAPSLPDESIRIDFLAWIESNRIEIIFGKSECSTPGCKTWEDQEICTECAKKVTLRKTSISLEL